ncbi:hypothetical protein BF1_1508, partial [Bifidobacterium bifidum]
GVRPTAPIPSHSDSPFQSTHPVRGATIQFALNAYALYRFQSTHPVRGATSGSFGFQAESVISIHAPREGCDHEVTVLLEDVAISIHAPREGCDIFRGLHNNLDSNFNPRTP